LSWALCPPQERHELRGARAHGWQVEYHLFLSYCWAAQGHQPPLRQNRHAASDARRGDAPTPQEADEIIGAAQIPDPPGEGDLAGAAEGHEKRQRIPPPPKYVRPGMRL